MCGFQGNFAQFLESADSVVSLTASEAGSGSFVNLFALTELKVSDKRQERRGNAAFVFGTGHRDGCGLEWRWPCSCFLSEFVA